MKMLRYLLLANFIMVILAATGCDKEESVVGEDDNAPTFAPEYIGEMEVTKKVNGFPYERTDSVVLRIKGTSYELYITSDPRSTSLCDSRGAFMYSEETKSVFLGPEDFTFEGCDTVRIPQGLFPATVTKSALNFDGFQVLPGTNDTVEYVFKLVVAPPR